MQLGTNAGEIAKKAAGNATVGFGFTPQETAQSQPCHAKLGIMHV
jgi:hypothetical protein